MKKPKVQSVMKVILLFVSGAMVLSCSGKKKETPEMRPVSNSAATTPASPYGESTGSKFDRAVAYLSGQLSSLNDSLLRYKNVIATAKEERSKDSLFCLFRKLHRDMRASACDSFCSMDSVQSAMYGNDTIPRKIDALLRKYGFGLFQSEGMWYIDEEVRFHSQMFDGSLSSAMKEFMSIRAKEQAEGFSEDAELTIPIDSVGHRAITWEKFIEKYPSFFLLDEAKEWYSIYRNTYLTGMSNSSSFTMEGDLEPGVKNSYEKILKEFPETKTGTLVKEWYHFLSVNNFKSNSAVDSFLRANDSKSMINIQPPTR
jgi:hypothetical protein